MRFRLLLCSVAASAALVSCGLALDLDGYQDDRECAVAEDCPAPGTCAEAVCVDGACALEPYARYTSCEGEGTVCNGDGRCAFADASSCDDPSQCASGFCVEGVCCAEACDEGCMRCSADARGCELVELAASNTSDCVAPAVCDGAGTCANGSLRATATLAGVGDDRAVSVDVTDDGGVVLTGRIGGTIVFDGENVPFGGPMEDAVTAKFNQHGAPVWIDVAGAASESHGLAVVAPSGLPVVVGGGFRGGITLAGELHTTGAGFFAPYLVALAAGSGEHVWGRSFVDAGGGVTNDAEIYGLATDAEDVLAVGYIAGPTDFGSGLGVVAVAGPQDGVLVRVDAMTGQTRSVTSFGGAGADVLRAVAVDADGGVVVTGWSTAPIDLGGGPLPHSSDTFVDPFVVALDAGGAPRWSRVMLAPGGNAFAPGVAIDEAGDVYIAGFSARAVTIDDVVVPVAGTLEGFLVKLSGQSGAVLWVRSLGANPVGYFSDVVIDDVGHVIVCGAAAGEASFGAAPSPLIGERDAFVASYTPAGELLYVRSLGVEGAFQDAVSLRERGGILGVAGYFLGAVAGVGGPTSSLGVNDGFVGLFAQ